MKGRRSASASHSAQDCIRNPQHRKLTMSGIPDIYQGDELWRLSLVDPDNRRPVDWAARRQLLSELQAGAAPTRATLKLDLIRRALHLRARQSAAFAGGYTPLEAGEGVFASQREETILVIVRVREGATGELEGALTGRWRDVLGERELDLQRECSLETLLNDQGLALFERLP